MSTSDYNNPVSLFLHQVLYALPLLQKNNIATIISRNRHQTNMGAIAHRQKPLTLCGSALREQPQQLISLNFYLSADIDLCGQTQGHSFGATPEL